MHLEGPWLSTTGKRKGKQKFRNAEQARKAREQAESWQQLLKKYEVNPSAKKAKSKSLSDSYSLAIPAGRNTTAHIKSVDTGLGVATKKESPKYTGTLIKGIATMHKSNAVPVLNQEDAEAISKMRR
jgi:beta-lactamase superfamily II metal-dependent hydrolase